MPVEEPIGAHVIGYERSRLSHTPYSRWALLSNPLEIIYYSSTQASLAAFIPI